MKQESGDNSSAYQAGRDLTVNNQSGLGYTDVKALCLDLIHDNFPKLQAIAMEEVNRRIVAFSESLKVEIESRGNSVNLDKLANPDVQAALNDALQGAAKKGSEGQMSTLSKLVTARLESGNSELLDIVIEEAIRVTPKLTQDQLRFLALHHYLSATKQTAQNIPFELIDALVRNVYNKFFVGPRLSDGGINYLAGLGLLTINHLSGGNMFEHFAKEYPWLGSDAKDFEAKAKEKAPHFHQMLSSFNEWDYIKVRLTSTGQAIALTNLSTILPRLDFKIWIK